jgi:hypothetical protein
MSFANPAKKVEVVDPTAPSDELVAPAAAAVDRFDIEALRLPQSFVETAGVKKLLTIVKVRRPNPQDFNRVHPDEAYRGNFAVIKLQEEQDAIYLLTPSIAAAVPEFAKMATLYTAVNRQGVAFLWPVMLPQVDGRVNDWHRSAAEAAVMAMAKWVRLTANQRAGFYEIAEAPGIVAEPRWPDKTFQELIRIAFRDHFVDTLEHPLIRLLNGLD